MKKLPYSLSTLFVKTNSSLPIFGSVKALEIKTSMLFDLDFANNTILLCFFYFFLINDLYIFYSPGIPQILNPIAKLVISNGISSKKAKAQI